MAYPEDISVFIWLAEFCRQAGNAAAASRYAEVVSELALRYTLSAGR